MENILTVDQAAEMLHLNPQVVRQYLREGKLPGVKLGRHWRVVEGELTEFVRGNRRNEKMQEWRSLSRDEKLQRIDSVMDKYADANISSEDIIRDRREEVERDLERLRSVAGKAEPGTEAAREEWLALSQEERNRRVNAARGMCAGGTRTLDDFLREKHEEIDEENRRAEERHKA